jgi:hypothetical protein
MRLEVNKTEALRAFFLAALGFAASFTLCLSAGPIIARRIIEVQNSLADVAAKRQPGIFHARVGGSRVASISFASFGVPDSNPNKPETAEISPELTGDIKDFKLVGTLSGVGAWIDSKNEVSLVLKGRVLDGYTLETIEPQFAIFSKGEAKYPVYLVYRSQEVRPAPRGNTRAPATEAQPIPAASAGSGVVPAEANGSDGMVARETLNELLMNPLAEVAKMRLVPTDNGMKIAGMKSDSLFSKLGMKPNDVITNVNGIGISDVGNVSNVISSMLSGTRLDFQLERGGESVKLGYAVK